MCSLVATVALGGEVAWDQGALPRRRTVDGSAPAPTSSVKLPLKMGDKLRISFDETIDTGAMKQSGRDGGDPQGALRTFYQRILVGTPRSGRMPLFRALPG